MCDAGANTTESYSYDPVGNRLSSLSLSPYSYNTSNELTSTPSANYSYDNNGNTASKTDSTDTTTYAWDYENRMTSATLPGTGGTTYFKYDPFGRRIYKQSPTATSIFAYDGDNLVETANASGGEVARYAQGQNIDEPLAMQRGSTVDYYEADGLGSITSRTAANGTVAQTYRYDSFGNTTNSSGSLTNFFRYTAREFDTETGLYYYRARYYDPNVGRFLGEDPAHFRAGNNFFRYAWNEPVVFTDPAGMNPAPAGTCSAEPTPYQKFKKVFCHPLAALYVLAVPAAPLPAVGGSGAGGSILTLAGDTAEVVETASGPVGWTLFLGGLAWGLYCFGE
jgi:RHS repeat-associated protein